MIRNAQPKIKYISPILNQCLLDLSGLTLPSRKTKKKKQNGEEAKITITQQESQYSKETQILTPEYRITNSE